MGLFRMARSRERGVSHSSSLIKLGLIGAITCCFIITSWWLISLNGLFKASSQPAQPANSSWINPFSSLQVQSLRKHKVDDTFGIITHDELMKEFGLEEWTPENTTKLVQTLKDMQRAAFTTVMFSVHWDFLAPDTTNLRWSHLDKLAEAACVNSRLKVALLVDLLRAPWWLRRRFPDSVAVDAANRSYDYASWFHGPAHQMALEMLRQVAGRMAGRHGGCVVAIQPVFNNEYEAKFTQEHDCYQDYSPPALAAYRSWLQSKSTDLAGLNRRWRTTFSSWGEVRPPELMQGVNMGVEDGARYWDWLRFREEAGATVFNSACAIVQGAGLQCFHHFPEFFSTLDAIYGSSMFPRIAASPTTDFIIMDTNLATPYGTPVEGPVRLRLYVAAAQPYDKPVYFRASAERVADLETLGSVFRTARLAGAANLGMAHWLGRVNDTVGLGEAMRGDGVGERLCGVRELVGVFVHMASCTAWQGLQWKWGSTDPLYSFMEDLATRLTAKCGTDIVVHVQLDSFHAALPTFSRAVFIEPLVLYGTAELNTYISLRRALESVPHEVLTLPTNSSRGLFLEVLQDL